MSSSDELVGRPLRLFFFFFFTKLLRSARRQPHLPQCLWIQLSQTCCTRCVSAFSCLSPFQHYRDPVVHSPMLRLHRTMATRSAHVCSSSKTHRNVVVTQSIAVLLVSLMKSPVMSMSPPSSGLEKVTLHSETTCHEDSTACIRHQVAGSSHTRQEQHPPVAW